MYYSVLFSDRSGPVAFTCSLCSSVSACTFVSVRGAFGEMNIAFQLVEVLRNGRTLSNGRGLEERS